MEIKWVNEQKKNVNSLLIKGRYIVKQSTLNIVENVFGLLKLWTIKHINVVKEKSVSLCDSVTLYVSVSRSFRRTMNSSCHTYIIDVDNNETINDVDNQVSKHSPTMNYIDLIWYVVVANPENRDTHTYSIHDM